MITGIMLTKNEADILPETLEMWKELKIPIVAMDDSDDGTYEMLKEYPNITVFKQSEFFDPDAQNASDWLFQAPLNIKRQMYGVGDYVFLVLGDEYWYHNPIKIAESMKKEEAGILWLHSMQRFMHKEDIHKWDFDKQEWKPEWKGLTNRERLLWYSPGHREIRVWLDNGYCFYHPHQRFNTVPLGIDIRKEFSKNLILEHYPQRDPKQLSERAKDRIERNYQPFYEHSYKKRQEEMFFDHFPGMKESFKFDGGYGEYEKDTEDLKWK